MIYKNGMIALDSLSYGGNGKIVYFNSNRCNSGNDSNLDSIKNREELIKNDTITDVITTHITNNKSLCFMPVCIEEVNRKGYVLKLHGILMNGSKVEVNLTDIPVFVDVLVPLHENKKCVNLEIQNILSTEFPTNNNRSSYHTEYVESYSLHEFSTEKRDFVRIFTKNTDTRRLIMSRLKASNMKLYSNDGSYYRKAAREYQLPLSDWAVIDDYTYNVSGSVPNFTLSYTNYKKLENENLKNNPYITKDRTLVMAWDIETYSSKKTGEIPIGTESTDVAFMICLTFHWQYSTDPLEKICIVSKDTESDSRWTTIVCDSDKDVIIAMSLCWNKMKPDIVVGYNDSSYDWPFIINKCIHYDILERFWYNLCERESSKDNILSYKYHHVSIKIDAERIFYGYSIKVPGTVTMDCLPCFMKIYPKIDEGKYGTLKYYLKDNMLPTKVDLPIPTLWKYYETGIPKHMREIAYYCIVDTVSVQRLLVKRGIITDYREVATLAYITLSDAYLYAGGLKVRNLVGSYACRLGILINMDNRNEEVENYPGAHVFDPDKGITPNMKRLNDLLNNPNKEDAISNFAKDRPVSCLDFASLYPNIIITYNLSPEKIILSKDIADKYQNTHKIEFMVGEKKIEGWSIPHYNKEANMGLFPLILKNLFAKRKEMKVLLKKYNDLIEIYEYIFSEIKNNNTISSIRLNFLEEIEMLQFQIKNPEKIEISPGSIIDDEIETRKNRINVLNSKLSILDNINTDTMSQDYSDTIFARNCIDKKQGALKIYMNTFYGETGNNKSPFYLLQLAGGVTSAGICNIKLAAKYAESKGYNIKYGDSIMPYTPITIKINKLVKVLAIESFIGQWIPYDEFKINETDRFCKEQLVPDNAQIWTESGFSTIKRIIRHKTTKNIFRIVTDTGLVDVTEDHSLLNNLGEIIKPTDCTIGTELLHSRPDVDINTYFIKDIFTTFSHVTAQEYFLSTRQNLIIDVVDNYIRITTTDNTTSSTTSSSTTDNTSSSIKKIIKLFKKYTGYVYDVETENGTFHAGVGNIIVKNTDSLYITCPNEYFKDCDYKFINSLYDKEQYFTAMVKITLRTINKFEEEINKYLEDIHSSNFLKMENEGCYYPCVFLGKKKYFGIQHVTEVNFNPKKLYIKGIEVIKKGKCIMEKYIGNEIMRKAVSLDNELEILDITEQVLKEAFDKEWDIDDFIQSKAWKPEKKNVSVHNFVDRMKIRHELELNENKTRIENGLEPFEILYKQLEPGERFNFVYVKNDILHDIQGRKIDNKASDLMEYAHVAKKLSLPIDLTYYMINQVNGTCARFISSDSKFLPSNASNLSPKDLDKKCNDNAKKYLDTIVNGYAGRSKQSIADLGKMSKMLYKTVVNNYSEQLPHNYKILIKHISVAAGTKLTSSSKVTENREIEALLNYSLKYAENIYKKYSQSFCKDVCTELGIDPISGLDIGKKSSKLLYRYETSEKKNSKYVEQFEYEIRIKLSDINILAKYKQNVSSAIEQTKTFSDATENMTEDLLSPSTLDDFSTVWYELIGIQLYKIEHKELLNFLTSIKYKKNKTIKCPNSKEITELVKSASSSKYGY
jgi:DNA polymerase elongation subunit (family B)